MVFLLLSLILLSPSLIKCRLDQTAHLGRSVLPAGPNPAVVPPRSARTSYPNSARHCWLQSCKHLIELLVSQPQFLCVIIPKRASFLLFKMSVSFFSIPSNAFLQRTFCGAHVNWVLQASLFPSSSLGNLYSFT